MNPSFPERHRALHGRLLKELLCRRLPNVRGWSHCGTQLYTEPTSLALLAVFSSQSGDVPTKDDLASLALQLSDGAWRALTNGPGVSFWATALAVNAL
jgi:hypothetical protein